MAGVTEVSDIFQCPLCLGRFDAPRIRPCSHTFCLKCLQAEQSAVAGEKNPCPTCRLEFTIPCEGLTALPKTVVIENLNESKKSPDHCEEHPKNYPIENLNESRKSSDHCEEQPKDNLIENFNESRKSPEEHTEQSQLTESQESSDRCDVHRNKPVKYYCTNCKTVICSTCSNVGHKSHAAIEIATVADRYREQLVSDIEKIEQQIQNCQKELNKSEEEMTQFLSSIAEKKGMIDVKKDELMLLIQKHAERVTEEIETLKGNTESKINFNGNEIRKQLLMLECFKQESSDLAKVATSVTVCRFALEFHFRAEELMEMTIVKALTVPDVDFQTSNVVPDKKGLNVVGVLGSALNGTQQNSIDSTPKIEAGKDESTTKIEAGKDESTPKIEAEKDDSTPKIEAGKDESTPKIEGGKDDLLMKQVTDLQRLLNKSENKIYLLEIKLFEEECKIQEYKVQKQIEFDRVNDRVKQMQEILNERDELIKQHEAELSSSKRSVDFATMLDYMSTPTWKCSMAGGRRLIRGLDLITNELYLVRDKTAVIEVYDVDTLSLKDQRKLDGLTEPSDLAACSTFNCLYVADVGRNSCIHQVDLTKTRSSNKWKLSYKPTSLSVTPIARTVLVVCSGTRTIREYVSGVLIRNIVLQFDVSNPSHAIQLPNGLILVAHGSGFDAQHRLCMVDGTGSVTKYFGGPRGSTAEQVSCPVRVTFDQHGFIFVADRDNQRVLLLSPALSFIRELVSKEAGRLNEPHRLCLDEKSGSLFVVNYFSFKSDILVYSTRQNS